MIREIPESVHAILSPSKAHLWLACAGGLAAGKGMPNRASKYAAEGTVYHDVARRALQEEKQCVDFVGDKYLVSGFDFTVDQENAEFAQEYVDQVRALPGKRFIEVDLEYSALLGVPRFHKVTETNEAGGQFIYNVPVAAGTGDCVVIDYEHKIVYVIDLKFGRGDIVYAKDNPQLLLYGAAAIARYDLLGIDDSWQYIGAISQPRVQHWDAALPMTVGELKAWTAAQRQTAQGAYTMWCAGPDQVGLLMALTPGEKQCRWCPISGNCKAQTDKILARFPKGHAAEAIPALVQLRNEDLAQALDLTEEVANWLSAVRAQALQRALAGHVLPNWKIVMGRRGNRALDEEATVQADSAIRAELGIEEPENAEEPTTLAVEDAIVFALDKAAYQPKKLLTVAKLQKPLEKKAPTLWAALQAHISQSEGSYGLERMEDPRPPVAIISTEFPIAPTSGASGLL